MVIVSYSMFARATVRYRVCGTSRCTLRRCRTLGLHALGSKSDVTSDKKEQKKKPAKSEQRKRSGACLASTKVGGMTKEELEAAGAQVALEQERQASERQKLKALIANLSSIPERERALLDNRFACGR